MCWMRPSVEPEVSAIPVRSDKRKIMKKLVYVYVACMLALLAACGTSGRQTGRSKSVAAVMEKKDTLTYEQRRKYDYYFLEAVRMKQKGEYDAAFELYKHCLDINPNSAPALYEISQFYMFLGQEDKGEDADIGCVLPAQTGFAESDCRLRRHGDFVSFTAGPADFAD